MMIASHDVIVSTFSKRGNSESLIACLYKVFVTKLTMRCYACVVLAMGLCLSDCLTSHCSIKRDERNNLVFGMGLLSTSPTLSFKEIHVSTKIRVLLSGTFS